MSRRRTQPGRARGPVMLAALAGGLLNVAGAGAPELPRDTGRQLLRFQGLMEIARPRDTHEIELPLGGNGRLELMVRAGKVSDRECHYYEILRRVQGKEASPLRIWRSAHALPCDRLAQDLRVNLAGYVADQPALLQAAATSATAGPAGTRRVALTPGSRIRSKPSLKAPVLEVTPGRREVEIGPLAAGQWHPVLDSGRIVGYVHRAVVEPLRSGGAKH